MLCWDTALPSIQPQQWMITETGHVTHRMQSAPFTFFPIAHYYYLIHFYYIGYYGRNEYFLGDWCAGCKFICQSKYHFQLIGRCGHFLDVPFLFTAMLHCSLLYSISKKTHWNEARKRMTTLHLSEKK